jgi:hypothetical protein
MTIPHVECVARLLRDAMVDEAHVGIGVANIPP